MPFAVEVGEQELKEYEEGGGLAKETLATRKRHFDYFLEYLKTQTDEDIETLLKSSKGREKFTDIFGKMFLTMRVKLTDGKSRVPKYSYAEKMKSNIKMTMMTR